MSSFSSFGKAITSDPFAKYKIGAIVMTPRIFAVLEAALDRKHELKGPDDGSEYLFGEIYGHNIAAVMTPIELKGGSSETVAITQTNFMRTFPKIANICLLGLAGAVDPKVAPIGSVLNVTGAGVIKYVIEGKTLTQIENLRPPGRWWKGVDSAYRAQMFMSPVNCVEVLAKVLGVKMRPYKGVLSGAMGTAPTPIKGVALRAAIPENLVAFDMGAAGVAACEDPYNILMGISHESDGKEDDDDAMWASVRVVAIFRDLLSVANGGGATDYTKAWNKQDKPAAKVEGAAKAEVKAPSAGVALGADAAGSGSGLTPKERGAQAALARAQPKSPAKAAETTAAISTASAAVPKPLPGPLPLVRQTHLTGEQQYDADLALALKLSAEMDTTD
ncbi:Hypothetical protein POVN_LOCUS166 [uncultured virus]|nr:Hypothetical protein POVN_LOCUS166 [uncultured virus]